MFDTLFVIESVPGGLDLKAIMTGDKLNVVFFCFLRPSSSSVDSLLRLRGRLLLDHEALSCLLVLLFVDEPKLNTSRLHRVLRNLCYHSQTRGWVIRSLLSILQRSSESEVCVETSRLEDSRGKRSIQGACGGKSSATSSLSSSSSSSSLELLNRVESRSSSQLSWLSVSMDAALGCRTNIFQIQRVSGRKHADRHSAGGSTGSGTLGGGVSGTAAGVTCAGGGGSTVHIHPQAAPVVCRHVLDTLIQLAKARVSLSLYMLHNVFYMLFCMNRKKGHLRFYNLSPFFIVFPFRCFPATSPSSAVRICQHLLLIWTLVFVQSPLVAEVEELALGQVRSLRATPPPMPLTPKTPWAPLPLLSSLWEFPQIFGICWSSWTT